MPDGGPVEHKPARLRSVVGHGAEDQRRQARRGPRLPAGVQGAECGGEPLVLLGQPCEQQQVALLCGQGEPVDQPVERVAGARVRDRGRVGPAAQELDLGRPDAGAAVLSSTSATHVARAAARPLSSRLTRCWSTPLTTAASLIDEPHDRAEPRHPAGVGVHARAPDVDVDLVEAEPDVDPAGLGHERTAAQRGVEDGVGGRFGAVPAQARGRRRGPAPGMSAALLLRSGRRRGGTGRAGLAGAARRTPAGQQTTNQ